MLTRTEVKALTGYMQKMDDTIRNVGGNVPDPSDPELAVLSKLEAIVSSPE